VCLNIKKVSDEEIAKFYTNKPISIQEVCKKFNLCNVTISRALKRQNVHIWTRQELNQLDLKVDYFKNIDDEFKAYFLGLIFADGCIFTNKYKNNSLLFSIQLQKSDGYIIEKLKQKICAPRQIVVDKRDGGNSLTVINNVFVKNLINHGIVEHKQNRKIPFLKDKMMRHFIRGLFDGDGSFFRTNHWNLFLCGHEYFHDIYDFLVQRLDLNTVKITFEDNIYQCRWGDTKNVQDFANYIYTDAHIYLTRKYDKFKEFGFV